MPNLKRVKADIAKWNKALGSLRNGNPIEIEGRLLLPAMEEGDGDSDLATCERMLERLKVQLQGAKNQAHRKGLVEGQTEHVLFGPGVPALANELNLSELDLLIAIPTGHEGRLSKRDLRSYARAKLDGTVEEYLNRAIVRRDPELTEDEVAKLVEVALNMKLPEVDLDIPEDDPEDEVKSLDEMTGKELAVECEKRGMKVPKVKKSLIVKAIREHDAKADADPDPEPSEGGEDDSEDEGPSNVNPLA